MMVEWRVVQKEKQKVDHLVGLWAVPKAGWMAPHLVDLKVEN